MPLGFQSWDRFSLYPPIWISGSRSFVLPSKRDDEFHRSLFPVFKIAVWHLRPQSWGKSQHKLTINCPLNVNYYKKVWNGIPENQPPRYSIIGRFCPNSTLFVSNTDIATLFYSDSTTSAMLGHYGRWPLNTAGGNETLNGTTDGGQVLLYKPFHVKYTKVYSHGIIYNLQKLFAIWDEWFQFRCQTSTITCLAHSMSLNQCMWRSKNSSQK